MYEFISELFRNYGIPMTLVIFFIFKDSKREAYMGILVDNLRKENKETLESVISQNTAALREFSLLLLRKPCLLKDDNDGKDKLRLTGDV